MKNLAVDVAAVAAATGLPAAKVAQYAQDEPRVIPDANDALRLARALGVRVRDLGAEVRR